MKKATTLTVTGSFLTSCLTNMFSIVFPESTDRSTEHHRFFSDNPYFQLWNIDYISLPVLLLPALCHHSLPQSHDTYPAHSEPVSPDVLHSPCGPSKIQHSVSHSMKR